MYKGKTTQRGWIHLPPNLLKHVVSIYLHEYDAANPIPVTWHNHHGGHPRHNRERERDWMGRAVWLVVRDYQELERVMRVCPAWGRALEMHPFWTQAIQTFDPLDHLGPIIQTQMSMHQQVHDWRSTPYKHFRTILAHTCVLCLINSSPPPPQGEIPTFGTLTDPYPPRWSFPGAPWSPISLQPLRRSFPHNGLGYIPVCREHDKGRHKFCGICLKSAPMSLAYAHYMAGAGNNFGMTPFGNINMGLGAGFSNAMTAAAEHEEVALNNLGILESPDPDLWPGVYTTCKSCRISALHRHIQANPSDSNALGGDKFNVVDYEIKSVLEGFIELGEGTVEECVVVAREREWLRRYTRLEDMLSQAVLATRYTDSGYQDEDFGARLDDDMDLSPQPRRSSSPVEYASSDSDLSEEEDADFLSMTENDQGVRELALNDWARTRILEGYWLSPVDQYYRPPEINAHVVVRHPAPWNVSEGDHPRREILLQPPPPTLHLVSQAYHAYRRTLTLILLPAMKNIVRRVVMECNEDGTDPALRASRMELEDVRGMLVEEGVWVEGVDWAQRKREESNSSNSGSGSGSNATSPVLSTTTLGTTPSPPPATDAKEDTTVRITIPITPVLDQPRLISTIPYVPVSLEYLPGYSLDAFRAVWREACAPLYHCRCRICERAMKAVAAQNTNTAKPPPNVTNSPIVASPTYHQEIRIGDEEGLREASPPVVEIKLDDEEDTWERTPSPQRVRKRSVDELEREEEDCRKTISADARKELIIRIAPRRTKSVTPSKRQRIADPAKTEMLNRKRSSEELDLDSPPGEVGKRRKTYSDAGGSEEEDEQEQFFAS